MSTGGVVCVQLINERLQLLIGQFDGQRLYHLGSPAEQPHTKGLRILSVYTLSDGPCIDVDTARDRGVTLFWTVDECETNNPPGLWPGGFLCSGTNVQNRL